MNIKNRVIKTIHRVLSCTVLLVTAATIAVLSSVTSAEYTGPTNLTPETLKHILTPDRVKTSIGTLKFIDFQTNLKFLIWNLKLLK